MGRGKFDAGVNGLNGDYIVVFGLPECLLSTTVWRGIFKCQSFTEKLIGVEN